MAAFEGKGDGGIRGRMVYMCERTLVKKFRMG